MGHPWQPPLMPRVRLGHPAAPLGEPLPLPLHPPCPLAPCGRGVCGVPACPITLGNALFSSAATVGGSAVSAMAPVPKDAETTRCVVLTRPLFSQGMGRRGGRGGADPLVKHPTSSQISQSTFHISQNALVMATLTPAMFFFALFSRNCQGQPWLLCVRLVAVDSISTLPAVMDIRGVVGPVHTPPPAPPPPCLRKLVPLGSALSPLRWRGKLRRSWVEGVYKHKPRPLWPPSPPPHSARCTLTGAAARGLPLSHARQPANWRSPHSPPGSAASGLAEPSLTLGWAASDLAGPSLTPLNQGTTDFLLFAC